MATATNGTFYLVNQNVPVGKPGTDTILLKHTSWTPGGVVNDTYRICKLPHGVTLGDCFVQMSDIDTNATPTAVFNLQATDGTTTKVLISGSTIGQAGGFIRPTLANATETGIGYTLDTRNYWLELKFTTAVATPASGTFVVSLTLSGNYQAGAITE